MPDKPPRACPKKGYPPCPRSVGTRRKGQWLCDEHDIEMRRESDRRRGTSTQRGYGRAHRDRFRIGVLDRDPYCVCEGDCREHDGVCFKPATDADHYPLSLKELIARDADPYDPRHGRGLCALCHSRYTSTMPVSQGYRGRASTPG